MGLIYNLKKTKLMEKQKLTQKEALQMLEQMDIPAIAQNLAYYAQIKDINKVELLLIGGVNPNEIYVNSKNKKVYTVKNTAIFGDIPCLKMLLEYGANIDQVDEEGYTALHDAINAGKADVVKFLIENGANVNALTKVKANALFMAEEKKNTEIIELLKKAGAREMTEAEKKEYKQDKKIKRASIIIMLVFCFGIAYWCTNRKSTTGGSSMASHTCTWCGKSYTGNGYMHIGDNCSMATNGWERTDHQCTIKCCEESWNSGRH